MSEPTVFVRMYKGLLGDCFLLRIEQDGKRAHILIDCGVLQGTKNANVLMQAVAEDIRVTCNSHLDLLVVTHEHWDHISGFALARDWFFEADEGTPPKIAIDTVWFGWTEKPGDPQAVKLRERFSRSNKAVAALAAMVEAQAESNPAFGMDNGLAFDNLQNFIGVSAGLPMALDGRLTGGRIMTELAKVARRKDYLEPGTERQTPGDLSLRTYVLGPPRDEEKLFKALASAGDPHQHLSAPAFNDTLFFAMAENPEDQLARAAGSPFAKRHRTIKAAMVENAARAGDAQDRHWAMLDWLRTRYYDTVPAACRFGRMAPAGHVCERDMDCGADKARKRIDGNWLAAAGALALKLDSDTNNTSLVLAFELPDKTVMLFAADAQVGNWESWADHKYDGNDIDALFGRVCFYKVGHHGSHNATRVAMGLEKMNLAIKDTVPLVAMIPTDEAFALEQGKAGKGWKMPAEVVRTPLHRMTGGRTLYGDRMHGKLPAKDKESPKDDPAIRAFPADREFLARLDQSNPLYVEYRIYGGVKAVSPPTAPLRRKRRRHAV